MRIHVHVKVGFHGRLTTTLVTEENLVDVNNAAGKTPIRILKTSTWSSIKISNKFEKKKKTGNVRTRARRFRRSKSDANQFFSREKDHTTIHIRFEKINKSFGTFSQIAFNTSIYIDICNSI